MPILKKTQQERNFVTIPNELLRKKDMSLPAKGLLCYMLSCSEEWKFNIKGLSTVLGTSEHLIGKYLTELEDLGYHKKEAIRENGKIVEWKYYVSDYPAFNKPEDKKPVQQVEVKEKKSLMTQCLEEVDEDFYDPDVKAALKTFLDVRIRQGRLSAKSWRTITGELFKLADNKERAVAIVEQATTHGWMKFYPLKEYKPKNKFVDDISPVVTDDKEGLLKQKYLEEYGWLPKCDRPSFEAWKGEQESNGS